MLAVSVQQERKSRGSQRKGRWCLDKSKASFHVIQKSRSQVCMASLLQVLVSRSPRVPVRMEI